MILTPEEQSISDAALRYIQSNEKFLVTLFANPDHFIEEPQAVTLFMAGAPGAGKTEVSKNLVEDDFFTNKPVRIDADDIRKLVPGYSGEFAHLYQHAAIRGVDILFNHVLRKNYNFILDGTFAYQGSIRNIERCLKHNRKVDIYYVYQDPLVAWNFTKEREAKEKRKVTKETFIKAYFASIENIRQVKEQFGNQVQLNVLVKDITKPKALEKSEMSANALDPFIDSRYTREVLEALIS